MIRLVINLISHWKYNSGFSTDEVERIIGAQEIRVSAKRN